LNWQAAIKGFKTYLKLERSLAANSISAYSNDLDKLYQYADLQLKLKNHLQNFLYRFTRNFINWVNELGMIPSTQSRIYRVLKPFINTCLWKT
jgi:integrase/recombinase XerD